MRCRLGVLSLSLCLSLPASFPGPLHCFICPLRESRTAEAIAYASGAATAIFWNEITETDIQNPVYGVVH